MFIYSFTSPFNADMYTPVELYLSLRNRYRKACLLESNDYHSRTNSKSFIGLEPLVEIKVENGLLTIDSEITKRSIALNQHTSVAKLVQETLDSFDFGVDANQYTGFFGRIGYEFAHFDESQIEQKLSSNELPSVHLFVFKYLIVIDHFKNDGFIIENSLTPGIINEKNLQHLLLKKSFTELPFETIGEETSEFTDSEFCLLVEKAKAHCQRGDVFQLVLSNAFSQQFFGDDFQVYRQLRRLNPSPYLFYFDFESYRLFGSSPEAQLIISNQKAEIHPIAGTVSKTGNEAVDLESIAHLVNDEKENAEHTMLVDLARNDLSKVCSRVDVERYKEVQHFSHVIHLVSKVTGTLTEKNSFETLNSSFPAGTLSGTPKPKALELISKYEKSTRDYYGGAIGFIGTSGDLNMAIVIRSMLSKNNELHYRAGAGIVLDSIPESEKNEVAHKLKAVRTAIQAAQNSTSSIQQHTPLK
jgi:anthranilate synthase component 1